ncbi:hypothetical protein ACTAZI_12010 [Legionella bozemanae]
MMERFPAWAKGEFSQYSAGPYKRVCHVKENGELSDSWGALYILP